jgi:hypothetical protein
VIAAELARRQPAAPLPSREEILAAVLDAPGREPATGDVQTAVPAPGTPRGADRAPDDAEAATIAALSRLGPGATRGEVVAATARLTALFGDSQSRAYYRSVVNEVVRGELPARVLGTAVRAARGPDVIRPGAAFAACVKRCRAVAMRR